MKTLIRSLLAFGLVIACLGDVDAQELRANSFSNDLASVRADTVKWFASGAIPGSAGIRVDTTLAATLNDTSYAIDISGAVHVAAEVRSRSLGNDSDYTMYAEVANHNIASGQWHTLNVSYSVNNTAGAQVGGSINTGRDTTLWLLMNDTVPDTTFTAQTGMTSATHGDQIYVRSNRYLRFWIDPDHTAADTTTHQVVVIRKYPR